MRYKYLPKKIKNDIMPKKYIDKGKLVNSEELEISSKKQELRKIIKCKNRCKKGSANKW